MQNQRRKSKFSGGKLLFLVIIFGLMVALPYFYWQYLNAPMSESGQTKVFVIRQGETTDSIAKRLESEGLIRSAWAYKWYLKSSGSAGKLQAGDFKLSPTFNFSKLTDELSAGSVDVWVRLLEGWRLEEMALEIEKVLGIKVDDFLAVAKEGYVFPDTYLVNKDATAANVYAVAKANFDKKFDLELQNKIKAHGLSLEEGLVLASLVEREGRSEKVRTEVASIMLKRLKMGMKLDIDATVQYAKDSLQLAAGNWQQRQEYKFWRPISRDDYAGVKSEYNTYLNLGLPPSPICNPSLASLRAVANADENTPYLFYYHDSAGNSHYARTLDEHESNVAKYR